MHLVMSYQMRDMRELFAALTALIWPLVQVSTVMDFEIMPREKRLVTFIADVVSFL